MLHPLPASLRHRLLYDDERLLLVFALYGLAAGTITYIDVQSYDQDIFATLSITTNFPTALSFFMIFGENFHVPVPIPVWNVVIVLGSVLVWSIIGSSIYALVKLFRMGS